MENSSTTAPAIGRVPGAQAAIDRVKARDRERNVAPRVSLAKTKAGVLQVEFEKPADREAGLAGFLDTCGTNSESFAVGLLGRLSEALARHDGLPSQEAVNWAFAAIHGIAPRDETEAMLAAMMVVTHDAAMRAANRLAGETSLRSGNHQLNIATKMMRAHAALVTTLKAHRTGGTQRVTVEHVTVNDGGQAIVGTVAAGGHREK